MGKATDVMDVCLLAGEIMLKYGGETYRVEETIERMAKSASLSNIHCFATPTGVFLSFEEEGKEAFMQMVRVDERMQDLSKIAEVNQVSRELVDGKITIKEAYEKLQQIAKAPLQYPLWLIHIAAGFAGSGFSYLFGGGFADLFPAFIAAVLTSIVVVGMERKLKIRFAADFAAAFVGATVAIFLVFLGLGNHLDQIIIGLLMPLVPGVPLTNGVRDIMAGDLLAGLSRGAEALLTSLSIATGVAFSISLFL